MTTVMDWIRETHAYWGGAWGDIYTFFNGSTFIPPIAAASQGSDAIGSDQTLKHGTMQADPDSTTVARELGRLSRGGMASLASRSQLAALGYWDLGKGSTLKPTHGLCNNVAIETTTALSIPLNLYLPLIGISVIIIIISYADLLGATKVQSWRKYREAWRLYSVGQLHRQVAEQLLGKLDDADPSEKWPDLKSPHACGFDIVEKEGSLYLARCTYLICCCTPGSPYFHITATPSSAQFDNGAENPVTQPLLSQPIIVSEYSSIEQAHSGSQESSPHLYPPTPPMQDPSPNMRNPWPE